MKTKKSKNIVFLSILIVLLFIIFLVLILLQPKEVDLDLKSDYNLNGQDESYEVEEDQPILDNRQMKEKIIISDDIEIPEFNDDLDVIKSELTDTKVLVSFLNKNFNINNSYSLVAQDPVDFYNTRAGNITDVAVFAGKIISSEIILTFVFRYDYLDLNNNKNSHFVAIFRDKDNTPKYITVGLDGEVEIYSYGSTFLDLIENEEARQEVRATGWALFPVNELDLSEVLSPFTWQELK